MVYNIYDMPWTDKDGTEEWIDGPEAGAGSVEPEQPDVPPEVQKAAEQVARRRVAEAEIVASTRSGVQDVYDAEAEHIAKVDKALGRIGKIGPLVDIVDAVAPDVLDAVVPGAGMVLGVATDTYVIAEAINAGVPAWEITKMVGVVIGEFVIGLAIPIPVLDEALPTNLICRAILRKYGERIKAEHEKKRKERQEGKGDGSQEWVE